MSKSARARELGISRSSLYYHPRRPERDEELRQQIEGVMGENPGYGHRRIADAIGRNRKCVLRVMKKFNLKPARRAKAPIKPEDVGVPAENFPDMLCISCPVTPCHIWASDFTFIPFHGRFVYLSTIIELFTREVLGWALGVTHSTELIERALQMALATSPFAPLFLHSDQGSEFRSESFREMLKAHQIGVSLAPKSSPWRNGSQESFFGRFKVEFGDPERFATFPELYEAIAQHIRYYNLERIHTAHRTSPVKFRNRWIELNSGASGESSVFVFASS